MQKFKIYRDSIDIDYYVYFTKSYFAFNAYLKAKHPTLTDLDKIREIKNDITFSRKFESLIEHGKHFRDDLIALKENLSSTVIKNNNEIITFDRVKIGDHNVVEIFNESYNGVAYFIKAIENDLFTFKVKDTQPNPFKIEELEVTLDSISITTTQKSKVKALINGHVESYNINLSNEIEKLKNFEDLSNTDKKKVSENLYKGFIEILYKLRNGLFHSEVEPNSDVMKVYKYTYFILRKILHEIPNIQRNNPMNEKEYDKKMYNCAKKFLLEKTPKEVTDKIIDSYLNYLKEPTSTDWTMEKIFLRFLESAQNANMKAGVIGGSIGGVENLKSILFDFSPKKVYEKFQDSEKLLDEIIDKLKPNGTIRRTERSIWPKYCKTIISMSEFLSQFADEEDFFKWANYFYNDSRSMPALPIILSEEVYGIGFPLACDFLKELGYLNYGKPDVHIKDIFEAHNLIQKNATNYQILKVIIRIANNIGVTAYNVDKLFWLIGSGKFYNHNSIPVKRLKDEFVKYQCAREKESKFNS